MSATKTDGPELLGSHTSGRLLWLMADGALAWSFAGQDKLWPLAECYSPGFLAWVATEAWAGNLQPKGRQQSRVIASKLYEQKK